MKAGHDHKGYDLPRWRVCAAGWRGVAFVGVRALTVFTGVVLRPVVMP